MSLPFFLKNTVFFYSFWGKFGQRLNLTQTRVISTAEEYFRLLMSDEIEVTNVMLVNEEVVEVHYNVKDEFIEPPGRTNVVIAAFTTSHARLKLYSIIEQLEERVLYFDTVSTE